MIGYIKGIHIIDDRVYFLDAINDDYCFWSVSGNRYAKPKLFDTKTKEYEEAMSCAATEMLRYPLCWKKIEFVEYKPQHSK